MLCTKVRLMKLRLNLNYMVQWSSSSSHTNFPEFNFQPKFSTAEQEKILNILNGSDSNQLSGFNVAQSKIKNLESYKKRKGPFKSLDELLEVDGLNVKTLEKLCKQLITDTPLPHNGKKGNGENKKLKQLVLPPLSVQVSDTLNSTVGIHLAPMGVSWAKILKSNNKLESWGYQDFTSLPKKLTPVETFRLALNVLNEIPSGDVYIFEGTNGISQGQKQPATITSYTLQLELSSMLLALINTSKGHNKDFQDHLKHDLIPNCVYYLRSKLPARLFKTLVGNECVSNTPTVLQLLSESSPHNSSLPCTPISVEQELKNIYLSQSSAHKELLGQALMLTITFNDLCINKNLNSIKAITPNRNNV